MTSNPSLLVFGAGGHGRVVRDLLRAAGRPVQAFVDEDLAGSAVDGLPVVHPRDVETDVQAFIGIGDNYTRERMACNRGPGAVSVSSTAGLHPSALVGANVEIAEGTVVMAGAVINTGTRIGRHCIVNTGALIDHDCVLEDFLSVAPGATLGGGVRIGRGTAVSLGASIIHGLCVGAYTVVGAGSLVLSDLPDRVVAYGLPARIIRPREPGDRYL